MRGVDCSSMSPNVSAKKLSTQGDTEKATAAKLFSGSSKVYLDSVRQGPIVFLLNIAIVVGLVTL